MPDQSSPKPALKRLAWITGALCVACCALPLIGALAGSAALAGLAVYAEQAAIAVLALGLALGLAIFVIARLRRRPTCHLTCSKGSNAG